MRDVAIVAFAQSDHVRRESRHNEVEMVMPVLHRVKSDLGIDQGDIDFTCSGSTDYLAGAAFSFVMSLDGVGAFPPIAESHVEMDGAWALYEAWVKIQTGAADTALVFGYGKSSPGALRDVLSRQLDPYYLGPLWPDSLALAALQARACIDAGVTTPAEMAEVAARSRRAAASNPHAQVRASDDPEALLDEPEIAAPLRRHDCPPITDGAAAVVLAAGDRAREISEHPVWIRGIDHRIESHHPGLRDLTTSTSTAQAAAGAGVAAGPVDLAELMVNYSPEEIVLRRALGLDDATRVNPSGGPLAGHPVM
ncbi:MAG TPA: lipid-transfer protein, partial [Acidimicrobiales bacterium]